MRTTVNIPPISRAKIAKVREMIIQRGNSSLDTFHSEGMVSDPEMIHMEFTFKAKELSPSQRTALLRLMDEAYLLRGDLMVRLSDGENPWLLKPWLINSYMFNSGVTKVKREILYLDQYMIEYILDDVRRVYDLVNEGKASNKIFLALNPVDKKCLTFNRYGFSHNLISGNMIRLMGVNEPIKLLWAEQLDAFKSIEYGPLQIKIIRDNFYFTLQCKVSSEELISRKRKHSKQTYIQPQMPQLL